MDVADILDDEGNMKAIRDWPKSWRTTISGIDLTTIKDRDGPESVMSLLWTEKNYCS